MPLPKMTPAARVTCAHEKRTKLHAFISSEQFTTTSVAEDVLQRGNSATITALKALEREQIITRKTIETELGRVNLWCVTQHGLMLSESAAANNFNLDIGRIAPGTIFHSLAVQKVRIVAEQNNFHDWKSSVYCQRGAALERTKWLNSPDALGTDSMGKRHAIEYERVFKSPRRYSAILANYLRMIKLNVIDRVSYIAASEQMAIRLQAQFFRITHVIFNGQRIPVTDFHRSCLSVFSMSNWPHTPIAKNEHFINLGKTHEAVCSE